MRTPCHITPCLTNLFQCSIDGRSSFAPLPRDGCSDGVQVAVRDSVPRLLDRAEPEPVQSPRAGSRSCARRPGRVSRLLQPLVEQLLKTGQQGPVRRIADEPAHVPWIEGWGKRLFGWPPDSHGDLLVPGRLHPPRPAEYRAEVGGGATDR